MNLENIDYKNLLGHLYSYKTLDFKVIDKKISVIIKKDYSGEIFIKDELNKSILKDIPKEDLEFTILKHITDKHITSNPLILDLIVNGRNTYYLNWSNDYSKLSVTRMSDFSTRYNHKSTIMNSDERYTLTNEEFNELINCGKNILEKLNLNGYPISFLKNEYDKVNVLENIIYKDTPEIYLKYEKNILESMAILKYQNALNDVSKNFWRTILEQENMLKKLDNPLLKEKDYDLKLYQYELSGEYYKGDGYETWKSNIEHYYISNVPLDEDKMKNLFENNESELRDIVSFNVKRLDNDNTYHRDRSNCYFVEVQNDGLNKYDSIKYITRNSNSRFNFLDKEIIFEEDKKIEVENNDDNEVSMFDNYDFKDSTKIIDDKVCNIVANNLDVDLSNSDIQLNINEIKNILSDIKESIYCGESFSDIEKDIFKLMNLTKEVSLKDKEDKDLKESILNDVTLNFRF